MGGVQIQLMTVRVIDRAQVYRKMVKEIRDFRVIAVTFNKVPGKPED
ncbi:MAG: hypothetical protein R2758_01820 [Bacteroidales bacterium]